MLTACAGKEPPTEIASRHEALQGQAAVDNDSRAPNMLSGPAVAGAIAKVLRHYSWTNGYPLVCTGVLVGRNKVLTLPTCVVDETSPYTNPADTSSVLIAFAQQPGTTYAVTDIALYPTPAYWYSGGGLAVVTLATPVPPTVVQAVAPVYLGNIDDAFSSGRMLSDPGWAIIVGYPSSCHFPFTDYCPEDRQYGNVFASISVGAYGGAPDIVVNHDPGPGAVTNDPLEVDEGSPLFLWDTVSSRFVVVGLAARNFPSPNPLGRMTFYSIAGSAALNGVTFDFASWLRPLLGPDLDLDGVPDDFDNCPPRLCEHSADCANPLQENGQQDNRGDACDPCANGDIEPQGRNSNSDAEITLSALALSDRCDPIPLIRFVDEDAPAVRAEALFPQGTGDEGPQEAYLFKAGSWMGIGSDTARFTNNFAFRFCSCFDTGNGNFIVDPVQCRTQMCQPGVSGPVPGNWPWQPVDVTSTPLNGSNSTISGITGASSNFAEEREGPDGHFVLNWWAGIQSGWPQYTTRIDGTDFIGTQGFIASAVLLSDDRRYFSARDLQFNGDLRPSLLHRKFPYMSAPSHVPVIPDLVATCANPFCHPWTLPWEQWLWRINDGRAWSVYPSLVLEDGLLAMRPDSSLELENGVSKWIQNMNLGTLGPWAWITASESGQRLRAMAVTASQVVVPQAKSPAARPVLLVDGDLLTTDGEAAGRSFESLDEAPEGGSVRLDARGSAAFSAQSRVLFLVGGEAHSNEIRRYHLDTGWQEAIEPSIPLGSMVLASTYDVGRDSLFVLDAVGDQARLLKYTPKDQSSELLWSTSFTGASSIYGLNVLDDGRLVITAADAESAKAWIGQIRADTFVLEGSFTASGRTIDAPVMGTYAPVLPLAQEGRLAYIELSPGLFEGPATCDSL